jgi:hypothetical protein
MKLQITKGSLLLGFATLGCAGASAQRGPETPRLVQGESARAIGIVRVHAPWYVPRFAIVGKFRDAVPEYERLANLESKYFTITDERFFGGIYVWHSRADADGYYGPAWREGIRERRGVDPELLVLDAPFVIEGTTTLGGHPIGERGFRSPATSTLVVWQAPDPKAASLLAANLTRRTTGHLVRAYVVTVGADRVGFIGLWPAFCDASAATSPAHLAELSSGFATGAPEVTHFDTPVMIDDAIRAGRK